MRAIVNAGPGRLEMRELPLPQPGAGEVRIRTTACGICTTDLEMIAGWDRTGFPAIPGHEWAGVVDAPGPGADPSLVGRRCVAENVLSDGGEVGFERPGGYGEYLVTEAANLHLLPDSFPAHLAALIEPLAVAVRALDRLGPVGPGRPVLVCGDGPIGLLVLMLLRGAGAGPVVLAGGRGPRLAVARGLGAAQAVDYHAQPLAALGMRFDAILEASGSPDALQAAFDLVVRGGRILVLGDYGKARAAFPWNVLLHREITLTGSNASAGAWPRAVRWALDGSLPLAKLVTHRLPVERFSEGLDLVRSRRGDALKVVLEWG